MNAAELNQCMSVTAFNLDQAIYVIDLDFSEITSEKRTIQFTHELLHSLVSNNDTSLEKVYRLDEGVVDYCTVAITGDTHNTGIKPTTVNIDVFDALCASYAKGSHVDKEYFEKLLK